MAGEDSSFHHDMFVSNHWTASSTLPPHSSSASLHLFFG